MADVVLLEKRERVSVAEPVAGVHVQVRFKPSQAVVGAIDTKLKVFHKIHLDGLLNNLMFTLCNKW